MASPGAAWTPAAPPPSSASAPPLLSRKGCAGRSTGTAPIGPEPPRRPRRRSGPSHRMTAMFEGRRVYVVIPAYNEEKLIGRVLDTMPELVDRMIAVDDASTDETARILCVAQGKFGPRLRVIRHE